ncbi:hypothetical protein NSU_3542 [Novosphingobium pentaromativorans US6-1]|uniref:HTH tetR-type domain-containing protein n=1 Tax=Novosphingobium pentaromativorans US6-1 TaxID=1088721 RepID=G6EGS1_9SPHN|nr:hypothetical protein NSU_3542 [Novosphingobium pentaromativorans US6-1]
MRKKDYHHGNLRQSLLDTAYEIVSKDGAGALTTKDLSRRLGVSAPALYRHYRSLRELLLGVYALAMQELSARILAARAETCEPGDQPRRVAEAIIDFGDRNPHLYRLVNEMELVEEQDGDTEAYRLHIALNAEIDEAFRAANPGIEGSALREKTLLMWFMIFGYVSVRRIQPINSAVNDPQEGAALREKLIRRATMLD